MTIPDEWDDWIACPWALDKAYSKISDTRPEKHEQYYFELD